MRARSFFGISEAFLLFLGWFGMAERENGFCTFRSSTTPAFLTTFPVFGSARIEKTILEEQSEIMRNEVW